MERARQAIGLSFLRRLVQSFDLVDVLRMVKYRCVSSFATAKSSMLVECPAKLLGVA